MLAPCFECTNPAEHQHHVVPRALGGTKTIPLCSKCHAKIHGHPELCNTSRLTREALAHKRSKKERTGGIPYGFALAVDGVHLEPHPEEQIVLSHIQELRTGRVSIRKIAVRLNAENVPSRGTKWHPTRIATLLARR